MDAAGGIRIVLRDRGTRASRACSWALSGDPKDSQNPPLSPLIL